MLELFEDMDFMKIWQEGFEELIHSEGIPGEVGAKSVLKYNTKGRVTQITETIIGKNLPDSFDFIYEAGGVKDTAKNTFEDLGEQTKWTAYHNFEFSGIIAFLSLFMKGAFVKQTHKEMDSFKFHAEQK